MIWQFLIKRPCYSDITIETNSLTVVSILKDVFGEGYMARDKKSGVTISCFKEKEKYLIGVNNASFAEFDSPIPLLHVIEAQEQLDPRFFVLHGASVGKNSTVFLLLAPSSGGKSVLTLYLCSNGLDYITEDKIIIAKKDFGVIPFTTPIHIRQSGIEYVDNSVVFQQGIFHYNDDLERFVFSPYNMLESEIKTVVVLFIQIKIANEIRKLDYYNAMPLIMKSLVHNSQTDIESMKNCARLARFPCYSLDYNSMNFVLNFINSFL